MAQATAAAAPERVLSLTLCATAAAFQPASMWEERAATVLKDGMAPIAAVSRDRWFTGAFLARERETADRHLAMIGETQPEGYAFCCGVLKRADMRKKLSGARAPALLIAGAGDLATPPSRLEEIKDLLPDAELIVVEAAHILNVERPNEVTGLIRAFLNRVA